MMIIIGLEFEMPEGATKEDCTEYVLDAVQAWRGQCRPLGAYGDGDPGDPMWGLDYNTVKILNARRSRRS